MPPTKLTAIAVVLAGISLTVLLLAADQRSQEAGAAERTPATTNSSTQVQLPPIRKDGERKLQGPLSQIKAALDVYGPLAARRIAESAGVLAGDAVRVIVNTAPGQAERLSAAAPSLGISVEAANGDLLQARAPLGALDALANESAVEWVRLPLVAQAADVITGKGVDIIGAPDWHAAGFTGSGTRIAILDVGFAGYQALLGSELPQGVEVHSCRSDGDITGEGEPHGTAVAEIVHEVAPDAQLVLANFDTEVGFMDCVDWLKTQDVQVVNFSVGFYASGPGDGTGIINEAVDGIIAEGALWVNSVGNEALSHWRGGWSDADADDLLDFDSGDETMHVDARAGEQISIIIKWDDPFGAACNDYDLYLLDPNANTILAGSEDFQDFCTTGLDSFPSEAFSYEVPETGRYHVAISSFLADGQASFHLYSLSHSCPALQRCVASGSVLEPADNAGVLSVGAVPWNVIDDIEPFSSRGPTDDGRFKPDVVAPDGVSNVAFGSFFGTSASAAHVSGAGALMAQWQPDLSPDEVISKILVRSADIGEPGLDHVFGAGRLGLGMPKPTPTPTNTPTATPTPAPTPTPTPLGPRGDVSCDRAITTVDAAMILQFTAGLIQALPCEAGADANLDGHVDAADAAVILAVVAELVGRLPVSSQA